MMPESIMPHDLSYQKAKTLTALHLVFLVFSGIYLFIVQTIVTPTVIPSFLPLIISVLLILIFKFTGSLLFSGNLICLSYFSLLAVASYSSGGIYSDDIVWAGMTPVFAFLFVNKRSGVCWFMTYTACLFYYYQLELNAVISFREQTVLYDASYYLMSWLLLFGFLNSVVCVFARGKCALVESLQKGKQKLILQREDLRTQAAALKAKEQELLKLNENLEHYAYAISHDLKEPLRTVKSYTQLLGRSLENNLKEKDEIYMNFVLSGTERMGHLLEDLLEFSRISEVHHEFVPVNLNDVTLLIINSLSQKVHESSASIEVEDQLPLVEGTQSLMVLVMQNLVSNAIKFRYKDRDPVIKIYHRKEADRIVICVEDNGIGIPDTHKEKVFELFNRLHTREKYDGSGIGLTTCGKIINSLGGEIWLESELGKGTTFMFSIPNKVLKAPALSMEGSLV